MTNSPRKSPGVRARGSRIEPEHVLLGLIRGTGFTSRIFDRLRLSPETIREEIEGRIQETVPGQKEMPPSSDSEGIMLAALNMLDERQQEKAPAHQEIPLSPDTRRVLHHAAEEADRLRHTNVGTPHLLLGLLRVENSAAASILTETGMRLDKVRGDIVHLLNEEPT